MGRGAGGDENRPSGGRALEQGVHGADQMPVGGDIDRHDLVPVLRLDVIERRALSHHPGIADQDVEPLITFIERRG